MNFIIQTQKVIIDSGDDKAYPIKLYYIIKWPFPFQCNKFHLRVFEGPSIEMDYWITY